MKQTPVVQAKATNQNRYALLLALCLAVFVNPGCSYQGAIKSDFNKVPHATRSAKIPLRVGVVQSSEFMEKLFVQNGADRDITIKVQPFLADAVCTEMASVFKATIRLAPAEIGTSNVDLLMFPTYSYSTLDSNRFFKTFSMKQELAYRFKNPRTNEEVATLQSEDVLEYSQPGSARAAAIVGIASAFLLTPITIPLETNALGIHAVDLVEASLGRMVRDLTDQIYMNRKAFGVPR